MYYYNPEHDTPESINEILAYAQDEKTGCNLTGVVGSLQRLLHLGEEQSLDQLRKLFRETQEVMRYEERSQSLTPNSREKIFHAILESLGINRDAMEKILSQETVSLSREVKFRLIAILAYLETQIRPEDLATNDQLLEEISNLPESAGSVRTNEIGRAHV